MKGFPDSMSLSNILHQSRKLAKNEKVLVWITIVVSLFALLELGQDYVKSVLNNSYYSIAQSLAYKIFWFVFIPLSYLFLHLHYRYNLNLNKRRSILKKAFLIIIITFLHLLIFSLCLYLLSWIINETTWSLTFLVTQKLSTRLYLGLSFYIIFSFVYDYVDQLGTEKKDLKKNPNALLVKSGSKTTLVDTQKIHRIVSDGSYLEIYTAEKKYVILGSLKHIINNLPENFKRIHKSTIVNISQIERSKSRGNGDYDLELKNGKTVRLSRNYAKPLKGVLL